MWSLHVKQKTTRSVYRSAVSGAAQGQAHKREKAVETHGLTLALAVLLAGCAMGYIVFRQELREYYLYFMDPRPALRFNFAELSDAWGESELKSYFKGADLHCLDNTEVSLGSRRCYLDINAYNDAPAMGIGFFLDHGRLQYASVNIPIWAHGKMHDTMTSQHGPSRFYEGRMASTPLDAWRLPGGSALFMSRDPLQNPEKWYQLFWASKRACAQLGC
jgi:hypothetical protein